MSVMSVAWQSLFNEEKPDWSSLAWTSANEALHLPCVIITFVVASVAAILEVVAAFLVNLGGEWKVGEWWSAEHWVMTFIVSSTLAMLLFRTGCRSLDTLVQLSTHCGLMSGLGCILTTVQALQEQQPLFAGRLAGPTFYIWALICVLIAMFLRYARNEILGFVTPRSDAKVSHVTDSMAIFFVRFATCLYLTSAFGWPSFHLDQDPRPWLLLFPACGAFNVSIHYLQGHEGHGSRANGILHPEARQGAEVDKGQKAADQKDGEDSLEADESEKLIITKTTLKARLTSALCVACCFIKATMSSLYRGMKALPWSCMATLCVRLGIMTATFVTDWHLTPDPLVVVMALAAFAVPNVADLLHSRGWLTHSAHLVLTHCGLIVYSGLRFYLTRSYVAGHV